MHTPHFSEQRLALALRIGRMGVWEWDLRTNGVSWSPEMFALTGIAPEDFSGKPDQFVSHLAVEDRARAQAVADETMRSGVDYEAELRFVRPDGAVLWIRNMAQLVRDEAGAPTHLVGITYDVTERRGTEEALRESRERLQASLSVSQTGTYRWELADDKHEWDENFERLFGLEPGQITPSWGAFLRAGSPRRSRHGERGQRAPLPRRRRHRPRVPRDLARRARALARQPRAHLPRRGRPPQLRDRRLRRRDAAEDHRRRAPARQGERRARQPRQDDFLATVSHELRTPLTAMLGWSRMINMPGLRAGLIEEGMKSIERNARAQAQLVEDLLDISRIISGKLEVRPRPMDLGLVIEAAAATLRPIAEAKSLALTLDLAPGAGFLDGDADRLQQVVANLLSNAVKFTPAGGAVHVSLTSSAVEAVMRVSDTGAGIAPDFLPLVFDRFRQADASSTRRHGGLGLGLAIVQHVVELHGGAIRAESQGVGQGSMFTVRLPRRAPAEIAEETSAALQLASTAPISGTLQGCTCSSLTTSSTRASWCRPCSSARARR